MSFDLLFSNTMRSVSDFFSFFDNLIISKKVIRLYTNFKIYNPKEWVQNGNLEDYLNQRGEGYMDPPKKNSILCKKFIISGIFPYIPQETGFFIFFSENPLLRLEICWSPKKFAVFRCPLKEINIILIFWYHYNNFPPKFSHIFL